MKLKFICTEHPEFDNVIINSNTQFADGTYDWRHYAGGIYLHGDVESANHFDCVELIEFDGMPTYHETDSFGTTVERCDYPTGIYECKVYGYANPCKAYIWSNKLGGYKRFHGLIVDINDADSVKYAEQKFNDKPMYI